MRLASAAVVATLIAWPLAGAEPPKPPTVQEARQFLDEVSRQWDAALGRLKQFVEE